MSNPYGIPDTPPKRSRSPLYIALGCGCALLAVLVLAGGGIGGYLLLREPAEEPTDDPPTTATSDPAEGPTDEPTEEPTEDPTDEPTEEPTEDPMVSLNISEPQTGTTLDTDDEELTTENGKFVGVAVTIDNVGTETIGLSSENFHFYDEDGKSYTLRYASFSTSGPELAGGDSASAQIYVDVAEDTVIESVSYSDPVGTGGQEVMLPVD